MSKSQGKKQGASWNSTLESWLRKPLGGNGLLGGVDERSLALVALKVSLLCHRRAILAVPLLSLAERLRVEIPLWAKAAGMSADVALLPEGSHGGRMLSGAEAERAEALHKALRSPPDIFVASVPALLEPAPPPQRMLASEIALKPGLEMPPSKLAAFLLEMDYDDEAEVSVQGEFARRGGIVDIFSPAHEFPVRVEYWGDTIESMRAFSTESQLSSGKVAEYRAIMRSGVAPEGGGFCFTDYAKGFDPLLIVAFPEDCSKHLERFGTEEDRRKWAEFSKARTGVFELLDATEAAARPACEPCGCFPSSAHILGSLSEGADESCSELARQLTAAQIKQWLEGGRHVALLGSSEGDMAHIGEWLASAGLSGSPGIETGVAELPCGVFIPDEGLATFTERELFSAPRRLRAHLPAKGRAESVSAEAGAAWLADLDEGDYAVHVNYGIGIFRGIKEIESRGSAQEVLELEFADDAIVHVPVWQAHAVSRYVGAKRGATTLSKVGSGKWSKTKESALRSVKSLALDMLRMQAVRSSSGGFQFPSDDLSQRLFEQAFPFEETQDQRKAAEEIKADMGSAKPMDRLLCGDVGYGKTEVAMRAAFKCVSAGRQVAVLVPTTVLAQQHCYSFRERFAEHPFIIETLSRFKSKSGQRQVVERLSSGGVDIVIGTHRLLQGDVRFKDLGLVVIDEEQRFGVLHKERLKRLRATVDILTMTATPIPRTLYLSMTGVRDLSTIISAPVRRLPVQTVVAQHDESLIASAIEREVQRGGQVFFLHNRVATIEAACKKIASLAPDARLGIAHGRMDEEELEEVMAKFLEGKIDVLVCTTIIESGLDIPNANTIVIDRADRFGLAELYQLRGRVGRWNRQAYAYLLLPKEGALAGDAKRRISAIRRYTHLGAGLKLALRDLEIRGSGNILGAEQSGHINAVGFDLYCQMLRGVVAQAKGLPKETGPETSLNLDFLDFAHVAARGKAPAAFPPGYINSERLRLDAYRRLAGMRSPDSIDAFSKELEDRFGKLPREASNMLKAMKVKAAASLAGFSCVSVKDGKVMLERDGSIFKSQGKLPRIDSQAPPDEKLELLLDLALKLPPARSGLQAPP